MTQSPQNCDEYNATNTKWAKGEILHIRMLLDAMGDLLGVYYKHIANKPANLA